MNEHLRDRILRKLETLSDERGYQVLDYAEFLESTYAERQSPSANTFTRFTEAIEDKLRAGKVSASAIAETVGFMNRAANVLNNAVETGKNMANELVNTARTTTPARSRRAHSRRRRRPTRRRHRRTTPKILADQGRSSDGDAFTRRRSTRRAARPRDGAAASRPIRRQRGAAHRRQAHGDLLHQAACRSTCGCSAGC